MRSPPLALALAALFALAACSPVERDFSPPTPGAGGGGGGGGGAAECDDALDCDDGDACTTDDCVAGSCANDPVDIDDFDACTDDACDAVTGVSHTAIAVDDGDACTDDACDPVAGESHTPIVTDDSDPCTTDACDPVTGESHTTIFDPTMIAITNLNVGTPDRAVLTNTSACPNPLDGLQILFDDSAAADITALLPSQTLAPGESVTVTDASPPPPGEIYAGGNISFSSTRGGAAVLCAGACDPADGTNVIDAVAFSTGAPHPALPAGVTFSPAGLTGVTPVNEIKASFHRTAFTGTAPSFLASDWTAGQPCALTNLELVEVNVGAGDFVMIHNPTICALSLGGLQLLFDDSSAGDATATLPAQTINPDEAVKVTDGAVAGTDILVANIPFSGTRGGNTLLCNGSCAVGANVIDAMSWNGAEAPTALPAGVTFSPSPLAGINGTNQTTHSFLRTGQSGTAPAFQASDWVVGAACTNVATLKLLELKIGTPDYVVVENPGWCTLDLVNLQVLFDDSSSADLTTTLAAYPLASRSKVYVTENSIPGPGEIYAGGNISFASTRGGAALLCNGACATPANVLDVVAFSTGAPYPALPAGITFSPSGLTGIDAANEDTLAWLRFSRSGANPAFLAGDWTIGPATK